MILKEEGILPQLMSCAMKMPVVETLTITHVDDTSCYIPSEKDILIMIQGANLFLESNR